MTLGFLFFCIKPRINWSLKRKNLPGLRFHVLVSSFLFLLWFSAMYEVSLVLCINLAVFLKSLTRPRPVTPLSSRWPVTSPATQTDSVPPRSRAPLLLGCLSTVRHLQDGACWAWGQGQPCFLPDLRGRASISSSSVTPAGGVFSQALAGWRCVCSWPAEPLRRSRVQFCQMPSLRLWPGRVVCPRGLG